MPAPPDSGERRNVIERAFNNLLERRIELLEENIDITKKQNKEYTHLQSNVIQLRKAHESLNEQTETSEKSVNKYVEALKSKHAQLIQKVAPAAIATAAAIKAYSVATTTAEKSTRMWLLSGKPINELSGSYDAISKRARSYQTLLQSQTKIAYEYGIETSKVTEIQERWSRALRFSEVTDKNAESLDSLTRMTILYANAMGVDAAKVQEEAQQRMMRFGESATEAVTNLATLRNQAAAVNTALGKSLLVTDEWVDLVNEVAKGTQGYSQDVKMLGAAMAYAAKEADAAGATYQQSLDSAKAFGKFISGDGAASPLRMMVGLDQLKEMREARNEAGELRQEYLSQFDEETQHQLKIIALRDKREKIDVYAAEFLQKTLATTDQGIRSQVKLIKKLGGESSQTMHILQNMGLSLEEAGAVSDRLADTTNEEEMIAAIKGIRDTSMSMTDQMYKDMEALEGLMRSVAEKTLGTIFGVNIDKAIAKFDEFRGYIASWFQDFENVATVALAAGIVAVSQFLKSLTGEKSVLKSVMMIGGAIRNTWGRGATHMREMVVSAAALNTEAKKSAALGGAVTGTGADVAAALNTYATGNALRVMDISADAPGAPGTAVVQTAQRRAAEATEDAAKSSKKVAESSIERIKRKPSAAPAARTGIGGGTAMLAALALSPFLSSAAAAAEPGEGDEAGITAKALSSMNTLMEYMFSPAGILGITAIQMAGGIGGTWGKIRAAPSAARAGFGAGIGALRAVPGATKAIISRVSGSGLAASRAVAAARLAGMTGTAVTGAGGAGAAGGAAATISSVALPAAAAAAATMIVNEGIVKPVMTSIMDKMVAKNKEWQILPAESLEAMEMYSKYLVNPISFWKDTFGVGEGPGLQGIVKNIIGGAASGLRGESGGTSWGRAKVPTPGAEPAAANGIPGTKKPIDMDIQDISAGGDLTIRIRNALALPATFFKHLQQAY